MRSLTVLFLMVVVATVVVVRQLPHGHAEGGEQVGTQQIMSVSIDGGGTSLPVAALRAQLTSRVGRQLDARALENDRAALESLLTTRGYLAARVSAPAVSFAPEGGAYIVFDIARGPMFHLRHVEVTGPGLREVGVVTLASGDDAVGDRVLRAKQALVDTFARRGQKVVVALIQRTDFAAATVDVTLATR